MKTWFGFCLTSIYRHAIPVYGSQTLLTSIYGACLAIYRSQTSKHSPTGRKWIRSSNVNIFCLEHFYTIRYNTFLHTFLCSTTYQKLVFYAGIPLISKEFFQGHISSLSLSIDFRKSFLFVLVCLKAALVISLKVLPQSPFPSCFRSPGRIFSLALFSYCHNWFGALYTCFLLFFFRFCGGEVWYSLSGLGKFPFCSSCFKVTVFTELSYLQQFSVCTVDIYYIIISIIILDRDNVMFLQLKFWYKLGFNIRDDSINMLLRDN